MKRHIATIAIALPLFAGGFVLAGSPMAVGPDGKSVNVNADSDVAVIKRLSQCIGKDVYNDKSKELGVIKDVVLDGGTNCVTYVVVSYGGVLGMGDKLFAVPWKALQPVSGAPDRLVLKLNEQAMKDAPGFDKDHWPDMANAAFRDQIDSYYSDQPKMPSDDKSAPKIGPTEKGLLWCRRVSAILGADVRSPADENLGDIEDLVVDARTGRVQYAVLAFGGVLGVGDKLFAIPISSLQIKADDEKFVLPVTKERLKEAPGFDKKAWPDFADPTFKKSIDDFYSAPRANAK